MSCLDLSFIKIGNCQRPTNKISINVNNISSSITNSIMNEINDISNKTVIVSKQNVVINGSCCGSLNINQTTDIKTISKDTINSELSTNILSSMINEYKKQLSNNDQTIKSLFGNHGQNITTSIKQSLEKINSESSVQNSLKKNLNQIFGEQTQNILINCSQYISTPTENGVCNINQEFLLQQSINNVFETIFKFIKIDPNVVQAINSYTKDQIKKQVNSSIDNTINNTNTPVIFWKDDKKIQIIVLLIIGLLFFRIFIRIIK